jgi:hypothetical protein
VHPSKHARTLSVPHSVSQSVSMHDHYINNQVYYLSALSLDLPDTGAQLAQLFVSGKPQTFKP